MAGRAERRLGVESGPLAAQEIFQECRLPLLRPLLVLRMITSFIILNMLHRGRGLR